MKSRILLAVLSLLVCLSGNLYGQEGTTIPREYPSLYRGVRPLGMGNAFIAMPGTDENAPFYNPAAINDYERKLHFRFLSPVIDFSPSVIKLTQDVIDLADKVNKQAGNAGKINEFTKFVDAHTGEFETVQLRMPVVQGWNKYFFTSVLFDSRTSFSFRNRAFTNIELASRSDAGGALGTAYNFKDLLGIEQDLQAGMNMKILYRYSIEKTITASDIVNNASFSDAIPRNSGIGVGFDLGFKGSLPTFGLKWVDFLKPTAGFTWQDVGDTRFSGKAPNTPQSVSIGFAFHPKLGDWQFHLANDFRELNQSAAFIRQWNIGAEVEAPGWKYFHTSFRIGGNQGYLTGGTTFDFRFFKLEGAFYGEEVSQFGHEKQLFRLATNLSFGF